MHKPASDRFDVQPEVVPEHTAGDGPVRRPLPPWLAEIEQRLRNAPSLLETLTEED